MRYKKEAALIKEKEKASEMMAHPILHAIYDDMLERAEMVWLSYRDEGCQG